MNLMAYIKRKEIEELRTVCNSENTEHIKEYLQYLENKRADNQNRPPANIKVIKVSNENELDDEFSHTRNEIIIYYKLFRSAPDIYKSFVHESNHANQWYLSNRDTSELSEFDKKISLCYKIGFCYNIADDTDVPSIQYLYNFNELDSRISELNELLIYIKKDINDIDRYRSVAQDFVYTLSIYNKKELKEYEKWFNQHYNAYHNQPENDIFGIMPSVLKIEATQNINVLHFFKNELKELSREKFKQLISLKEDLKEIVNILNKGSVQKEKSLEKYSNKIQKDKSLIEDDIEL